jgi:hypothetical protein
MDDKNTKQPGPHHGQRLFRGLDHHESLPFSPGPMVRGTEPYATAPASLLSKPDKAVDQPGRFGRLFSKSTYKPSREAIKALAATMMEQNTPSGDNSDVALGFTFLAQFVDHDLTLDTTAVAAKHADPAATTDFRTPNFDLDNLYGSGPGVSRFMYDVSGPWGKNPVKLNIDTQREFDLPRNSQNTAIIGDLRNDENFLVSQLHLAFMKFHNVVVDSLVAAHPVHYSGVDGNAHLFMDAHHLVRWHYQWILLHDFLPTILDEGQLEDVRDNGPRFFKWQELGAHFPFMPVEFSTAAYRLGHTMLRQDYQINDLRHKDLFELPVFGSPRMGSAIEKLDFTKFFDFPGKPKAQRARKFDAKLSIPVFTLPFIDKKQDPPVSLAERNMLRGLIFSIPSGQEVATIFKDAGLKITVYSNAQLGIDTPELSGLRNQAPLFYYILKESEFGKYAGRRLGPVGSRIVAEVFYGLLGGIAGNYLKDKPNWTPTLPDSTGDVTGQFGIVDLLTYAGA